MVEKVNLSLVIICMLSLCMCVCAYASFVGTLGKNY